MNKTAAVFLLLLCCVAGLNAQTVVTVTDNGNGVGTTTWTSNNIYLLDGEVFVNDGQALTIEPGTVIWGKRQPAGTTSSALVVSRGGQIFAAGTAAQPIVFTAENDNLADTTDFTQDSTGLWGGLVILGEAPIASFTGTSYVGDIDSRHAYGGTDIGANVGVLKYISVRHAGGENAFGSPMAGLTLAGVGYQTYVDNIEVIFSQGNGINLFGGDVRVRHAVSAFNEDDCFEFNDGFHGYGQYWLGIQRPQFSGRGLNSYGSVWDVDTAVVGNPLIFNATMIGSGVGVVVEGLRLSNRSAGTFSNCIFLDWGTGLRMEVTPSNDCSYEHFKRQDLKFQTNVFWDVAGNNLADILDAEAGGGASQAMAAAADADIEAYFVSAGNLVDDPALASVSRQRTQQLDPRPAVFGPGYGAPVTPPNNWFDITSYKGAFSIDQFEFWAATWTGLDHYGYLPTMLQVDRPEPVTTKLDLRYSSSQDEFVLNMPVAGRGTLQVMDLSGRLLRQTDLGARAEGAELRLSASGLASGLYLLRVQVGQQQFAGKTAVIR